MAGFNQAFVEYNLENIPDISDKTDIKTYGLLEYSSSLVIFSSEKYLFILFTPQTLKEQAGVCHTDLFLQMQSDIDRIGKILSIEAPLWSKQIGLAGRTDCIGEYDGKLSVIDFKSASKPKSEDGILEYFTQATAYALMWQARTGQPVPNISIIIGVETGECQVFQTNPREHVADLVEAIAIWRADQEFSVAK